MPDQGLELRGLVKRYGSLLAVNDLSFDVQPGEVFGFVGSNGAGKTTTMRIVLGTLLADKGEVSWAGKPMDFETRRRIGYMPEERGLYPRMRAGEQLIYLAQLHGLTEAAAVESSSRWLERFGLKERARDDVQKLSHGNQQKVQLAAALVFDPMMLVLDEPFAGLDPEAVDSMSEVLHERAAAGIPVIFSSHQLELVERLCDRVAIIQKGRLIACGSVDELRSGGPVRLWVDAPAAPRGWAARLPGVEVVSSDGTRVLVQLNDSAGDQSVLQAALATGPVHEFRRDVPSLLDIFREAMSEARVAAAP
ncbi:MAG TPA: ATP-binding cassette domain-containing protein [Candidatus Dormibacteraeota bacterium]|jgi:ABC-2 type transport system ATP-binding protein|nr:ATP-binding cassette domain-containing protein [Candidatus Dormibacteraeota bacterium]HEX2680382.1 ATP-binding cassette domain-containing protein [Candidatus Dormibacteraeota bacterium]